MKKLLFIAIFYFAFLDQLSLATVISPCAGGQSFWCSSLANAKLCNAVNHCIQVVWENEEVPEDTDSICQICLDMVKQARDQLCSNETEEDLKKVFEGSCELIPLSILQKECIKTVDDFIPELIEALKSQMNPQMVCSVAGLCNNVAIDEMLKKYEVQTTQTNSHNYKGNLLTCNNCHNLSDKIIEKLRNTDRDITLQNILNLCGKMSSFSDACYSIVKTHFNSAYEQLKNDLSSKSICHVSGVCSWKYHSHAENDDSKEMSLVGNAKDETCDLCKQLIKHLRDILITNTTEDEFKMVLQGICGQTNNFKSECLSIVDQYYKTIYETLVHNLDAEGTCFLIGLCQKGYALDTTNTSIPPAHLDVTITKMENEHKLSNLDIYAMQKPINNLMAHEISTQLVQGGELCAFCEYFLHIVQETITLPRNEEKIKQDLELICKAMPATLKGQCHDFIEMYSDAVVALLVEEMDPREICPYMKMCSPRINCPLCLFAVQELQTVIKDKKTKESAMTALNNLCNHFPNNKLKAECTDFVKTYTSELIDLLIKDFTPQEICTQINICDGNKEIDLKSLNIDVRNTEIESKEAPLPECILCKEVIKMIEKELINAKSKEDIIATLKKACLKLHRGQQKCDKFIDKYGEMIADLILNEAAPSQICSDLLLCSIQDKQDEIVSTSELPAEEKNDPPSCAVCELIMTQMEQELKDKKTQDEIKAALLNICHKIPNNLSDKCSKILNNYSDVILQLLITLPPKEICKEIQLCTGKSTLIVDSPKNSYCPVCEIIITQLEQRLKEKKTKDEIKQELSVICHKVPKQLSSKCSDLVEQYSDDILDMLDNVPPKEICTNLNLCSNINISDAILECGICQGISNSLISEKDKELTVSEVKVISCESFPSKYYDKCTNMVKCYSQSIQNLIKLGSNESEICIKIGKCFDNEGKHSYLTILKDGIKSKEKLVGANECTFGPTHWCSSKETATKCDVVGYCEKVAWSKNQTKED